MSRTQARPSQILLMLVVPALLFAGLYARSLDYDFVWTDQGEIELGLIILPPGEIHTAFGRSMLSGLDELLPGASAPYYRPLQVISASLIDHHLGRVPRNFRALNLLLGMLTSSLVAWLAWLLFGSLGAALVAGMIFAVHPANIENYVWIAGLSQSLASFFIVTSLASAVLVLRGLRGSVCFGVSLLALLAALCSKENAAITPGLVLALSFSLVAVARRDSENADGDAILRRSRALLASQLALTLLFVLVWRPHVLGSLLAEAVPLAGSSVIQTLTGIGSWPQAMGWIMLPLQSTTSDVVTLVGSPFQPSFVSGLLFAGISLAIWWRMLGIGLEHAALGLAWIWIAFAPTSGLIPLNHMRGERYLSLSLLGLAILLPALGLHLRASLTDTRQRLIVGLLAGVLILGLAQRSWQRIPDWRSDLALFSSDVGRDPLYREGYHELAKAHIEAGDMPSAKQSLEALSQLNARFVGHASFLRAEDAIDLECQVNLSLGKAQDSMRYFESLRADSPQLQSVPSTSLCGARSLRAVGRVRQAEQVLRGLYERAPAPYPADAAVDLADIYLAQGRLSDARRWVDRVEASELRDPKQQARLGQLREDIASASRVR